MPAGALLNSCVDSAERTKRRDNLWSWEPEKSCTQVMGVVNVTPDSFSDGGSFFDPDCAIEHALRLVADGAAIVDVGGESTRPGSMPVSVSEELARVIPVIKALADKTDVLISIDSCKAEVMAAAIEAGAGLVNDINALQNPGTIECLQTFKHVSVCLMHKQGEPKTMQVAPTYNNVVAEVKAWLLTRATCCQEAGISRERILLDPGIGFGKTLAHNLTLLNCIDDFVATGFPILLGLSRKSLIGQQLERSVDRRLAGSLALAAYSAMRGVAVVRVHDVAETVDVVRMLHAVQQA